MRPGLFLGLAALLAALGLGAACQRPADPPPKPPPPPLEYLGEWGVKGDGPGKLSKPVSIATDTVGNVYVADQGSRFIHKFDPLGHPLLSFDDPAVVFPGDIAVDRGGAIYVADPSRSSIFIFYPDGTRLRQISCAHRGGRSEPLNVAVDDDGNVFVVAPALHRIQKFNSRGRLLKAWDAPGEGAGQYAYPVDVAVAPDGFLYVADARWNRIQKFTRDGELVAAWGREEIAAETLGRLDGISVSEKHVFAVDGVGRRLHAWTLDGHHQLAEDFSGYLTPGGEAPGLAVSPRGELLVLDSAGARVLRFGIRF